MTKTTQHARSTAETITNWENAYDGISMGVTLGTTADGGKPVFQFNDDRYRHTVILGRTGSGKSNHLQQMEREDIRSGAGVFILAAHEEDALYPLACVPDSRRDDVVLIDAANPNFLPRMNPLDVDLNDPEAVDKAISDTIELLRADCQHDWAGPRFEHFARMGLGLMMRPEYPHERCIANLDRLFSDADYVKEALAKCGDRHLYDQWKQEAASHKSSDHDETIQWFISKVSRFANDRVLRHVFGSGKSTIDMRDIVDNGKILVASVPEARIGTTAARTLCTWLMMQLHDAILHRGAYNYHRWDDDNEELDLGFFAGDITPTDTLDPFFVYVDEFAKYASKDFAALLAEARKYHVGFVLAFQTLSQTRVIDPKIGRTSDLEEAILGNVGTTICYPMGSVDARAMARQLDVDVDKLRKIGRYQPLCRICMDNQPSNPVTLSVGLKPEADNPENPRRIVVRQITEKIWLAK